MTTTGRSRTDQLSGARARQRPVAAAAAALAASLLAPLPALAQRWTAEAGVSSQLTWSSNPALGIGGGRDDTLLELRPHIAIHAEGSRLRVNGSAALNGIASANGTQPNRVLPEADINARLEAVERLFFVESDLRAVQVAENPFGALPESGISRNTITTTGLRISPILQSQIGPDTRWHVRSDNTQVRESGAQAATTSNAAGYFGRHTALVEHDPRPFGWRLEAERSDTRYRDTVQPPILLELARATVDYAFGSDITAGVRVGREHMRLASPEDQYGNIYGAQAHWHPSPRTTLSAYEEKRFFGKSWNLSFDHRLPKMAWNVLVSRTLDTTPQSLFDLPASDNVSGLLDNLLASRFPDPIERARVVRDIITRQGLPGSTAVPFSIYAQRFSVLTQRRVSLALLGARNTVTLAAFNARTEDAPDSGSLVATGSPLTNNVQNGASAAWSYRATPHMNVNLSGSWTRIRALQAPDRSIERTARLQLNMQAAPRTTGFAGVRYRELGSNVVTEGREGAVYVGVDHIF